MINGRRQGGVYDAPSTTIQSAAASVTNGTAYAVDLNTMGLTITVTGASTPSLTLDFQVSLDGGINYIAAYPKDLANVALAFLTTLALGDTTVRRYLFEPIPGATHFRAAVTARVTGNVTVTVVERRRG
jgi:hypothetical protein